MASVMLFSCLPQTVKLQYSNSINCKFTVVKHFLEISANINIMSEYEYDIGESLRACREECGYSLLLVEKETGVNNGNLSRYERNLNVPGIDLCIKLADFYGVSLDMLVGRPFSAANRKGLSHDAQILLEYFESMRPDLQREFLQFASSWANTQTGATRKKKEN